MCLKKDRKKFNLKNKYRGGSTILMYKINNVCLENYCETDKLRHFKACIRNVY